MYNVPTKLLTLLIFQGLFSAPENLIYSLDGIVKMFYDNIIRILGAFLSDKTPPKIHYISMMSVQSPKGAYSGRFML